MKKNVQSHTVSYKNYELTFPLVKVMREILALEDIIVGHVFYKHVLKEQLTGEIKDSLDEAVKKCKNVNHIKNMAGNSSNGFYVELATNFLIFSHSIGN